MASKSPLHKLQDTVVGTVKGAITHPVGTAEKTVGQAKGAINLGRLVAEQVAKSAVGVVTSRLSGGGGTEAPDRDRGPLRAVTTEPETAQPEAPETPTATEPEPVRSPVTDVATKSVKKKAAHQPVKKAAPAPESPIDAAADTAHVEATPGDVARTVAKKASAKKTAKKAAKKAPAKKAPAKKAAATKATAEKSPAKKASTPSAKLPAAKAPATPRTAAEVLEDTSVETPVGTTGADVATNPDTTDHDLQQPGTEPLVDPSTTKSVASEQATLSAAADPEKG